MASSPRILIELHPRFVGRVAQLDPRDAQAVERCLAALTEGFGNVHVHAGLGIRKLRRNLFECRAGLRLRLVFFVEPGAITVFDAMTHDELAAFLKRF